jgi:hypothetical protein
MSCVCILAPVVIASWPTFSAAALAAATSLGFVVVDEKVEALAREKAGTSQRQVNLEIAQSEIVTGTLGRDQRLTVGHDGVTVVFSRDARGKASVCVTGEGRPEAELRAIGEQLCQRVVQKYVHQRLLDEMRVRQFLVVEEEVNPDASIRIKVRHWEN